MNITLKVSQYIARYAPSHKKICEYLEKKKVSEPKKFLQEIWYNEDIMLEMWIRTFINMGKWEKEMMRKLLLKWFSREKILWKISEWYQEITNWENIRPHIVRSAENKLQKWKSLFVLQMEYIQKYPYFKEKIIELFCDYDDSLGLQKEIEKYRKKYNINILSEKQKFFSALMRKWFRYDEIKKHIHQE